MAGAPIKFRCYRCNQLLGVSLSKAGGVVACPKCSAELRVPQPSEPGPAPGAGPGARTSATAPPPDEARAGAPDAGLSLDLLDIRPEDIRVEPGVVVQLPTDPAPPPPGEPGDEAGAIDVLPPIDTSPRVPKPPPKADDDRRGPAVDVAATILAPPPPPDEPAGEVAVPPILVDAPRVVKPVRRGPAPRARDVLLPRSAVAAWSLFVILALGLAFLAGLLAGHYVWRVH
jgi:hypothetical protein